MRRLVLRSGPLLLILAARASGQAVAPTDSSAVRAPAVHVKPAHDSLFRHARRLVGEGSGAAGRSLVDSLLRAADPASPTYGDALYWHGVVALTATEAERDYRRVIVEYPLSSYKDDALLSLAELEQARGDRASALQHLQRYVKEHGPGRDRGLAALGAARLAFDQRDAALGCSMLAEARRSAAPAEVELRNQIEAYGSTRCAGYEAPTNVVTRVAPSAPVSRPPPSVSASTPAPAASPTSTPRSTSTPAPRPTHTAAESTAHTPPAGRFTIQVAAYETRAPAEQLVARLATRGVKARVSGTSKPFRVRLGFYRTRQDAANDVAALRKRGMVGFVAEEASMPDAQSP